jgi:flagellar motility protein MotE (MotC chaperone)
MKNPLLSPKFILPVTVLTGVLVLGMRVADIWDTVGSGKLSLHPAQAQEAAAKPAKDAPPAPEATASKPADAPTEPAPSEAIAADSSPAEQDVLKQIAGRREELDKRAGDLDTREALLNVTEQRIDQKAKELDTLRQQLQAMVNQGNEAQQAQLDNLVKIYETMKPDEAARIFETLDMPILIGVIQKMKPARTAPIMAKMPPAKAKEVTNALTHQDQLPQVK